MSKSTRTNRILFLSGVTLLLTPAFLITACSEDSATSAPSPTPTTTTTSPVDGAAADTSTTDSSPTADATSSDPNKLDDGTYEATVWTCAGDAGTIDVIAYATSIQIDEVQFTVNGTTSKTDALYTGAPACTRTIPSTLTYPASAQFTTTSGTAFTCSATCDPSRCTAGSQPVIVDTFSFTKNATGFVATRTLGTPLGLQLAAGCSTGGNETITWTKL